MIERNEHGEGEETERGEGATQRNGDRPRDEGSNEEDDEHVLDHVTGITTHREVLDVRRKHENRTQHRAREKHLLAPAHARPQGE